MITESTLCCPHCSFEIQESLQENVWPTNFRCESCHNIVKISFGQCCIYCQYGDYPCLQTQIVGSACCNG